MDGLTIVLKLAAMLGILQLQISKSKTVVISNSLIIYSIVLLCIFLNLIPFIILTDVQHKVHELRNIVSKIAFSYYDISSLLGAVFYIISGLYYQKSLKKLIERLFLTQRNAQHVTKMHDQEVPGHFGYIACHAIILLLFPILDIGQHEYLLILYYIGIVYQFAFGLVFGLFVLRLTYLYSLVVKGLASHHMKDDAKWATSYYPVIVEPSVFIALD